MEIFTLSCPTCGTVVAANELEQRRRMKCPGLDCEKVLAFEDLPAEEREHFLEHRDAYRM
jgi:hypothetical protein